MCTLADSRQNISEILCSPLVSKGQAKFARQSSGYTVVENFISETISIPSLRRFFFITGVIYTGINNLELEPQISGYRLSIQNPKT